MTKEKWKLYAEKEKAIEPLRKFCDTCTSGVLLGDEFKLLQKKTTQVLFLKNIPLFHFREQIEYEIPIGLQQRILDVILEYRRMKEKELEEL